MDDCIGCPQCGGSKTSVADSREFNNGLLRALRRRRACKECGHRYNTLEVPESVALEIFTDD